MYCYSNNGLSCRLVEDNYSPVSGEWLSPGLATAGQLEAEFSGYTAAANQNSIKTQIVALEQTVTLRMMREAFLNTGGTISDSGSPYNGMTAQQVIAEVQTQIAALRAQL